MKGFRIARVFGIDIEIHWSLLAIFGLIIFDLIGWFARQSPQFVSWTLWFAAIFSAVIFIFSVIFHEMAHSLTARMFNIRAERITLFIFGGIAQMKAGYGFGSPKKEFWIAITGPISSFFLAGIFTIGTFVFPSTITFHVFNWLSIVNFILATFNLVPCFPMDGGRVFRAICWWLAKDIVKATGIAVWVGIVFGIAMVAIISLKTGIANALWIAFIVFFIIIPASIAEYRALKNQD